MLAPLSRLLLDLHPALLLLLLLDFLLLILLLTPFVVSGFGLRGRSRPHAASRGNGWSVPAAPAPAAATAWAALRQLWATPPPCRSLFQDKASV